MSKLGSLYIAMGSPEGEISGGCCEIDGWAADEIERLIADLRESRETEKFLRREIEIEIERTDSMQAKLAEAEKDAQRYRWLCDASRCPPDYTPFILLNGPDADKNDIDAAIDAAIRARGAAPKGGE